MPGNMSVVHLLFNIVKMPRKSVTIFLTGNVFSIMGYASLDMILINMHENYNATKVYPTICFIRPHCSCCFF